MTNPKIDKWSLRCMFYSMALAIPFALITHSPIFYLMGATIGLIIATTISIKDNL